MASATAKAPVPKREKTVSVFEKKQEIIDIVTGEVVQTTSEQLVKTSGEPDYIKVYYEQMLTFNHVYNVPTEFILSVSKFLEWSNEGSPMCVTLNRRVKEIIQKDCGVASAQVDRYIKACVDNGVLLRTGFRGVYEANPFFIAKGRWDSIKRLQTQFDYVEGHWTRRIEVQNEE